MKYLAAALFVISIAVGWRAFADESSPAPKKVVYEKKTRLDFEARPVDGEFLKPEGSAVKADQNLDFDSLLNPRKNFKKELKRSSGAVR